MGAILIRITMFYLVILSIVYALQKKLMSKYSNRFGYVMFPLIASALIITNLHSFPSLNDTEKRLALLPSNALIDLRDNYEGAFWPEWTYSFIEIYYNGRTLLIPISLVNSHDLDLELLLSQGRLDEVQQIEYDAEIIDSEINQFLSLEYVEIQSEDGNYYYLITEEGDPTSPLLLLSHGNRFYFVPKDLIPDLAGNH